MTTMPGEKEFARLLGPGIGYGVVVGVGFAFAGFMVALTMIQKRFTKLDPTSAIEFATASQSVKAGLVCCSIVSAWTWSATLLQSSVATYEYGVSASYWYAVGGTIQIAFFAMIAAKVKMNANGATTFLQIVKARYGVAAHILFTTYALICVHIVSGSLVLGASATFNALTDTNTIAVNFLLPIGIAVYVVAGGLRATFIADFVHTVILFVIIYIFQFSAYATSDKIGSPGALWDLLQTAAVGAPVAGNTAGSYVTMKSNGGMIFAGSTMATGFAGVFCDQGYWQRAIASRPESTTRAYIMGGLSWFGVPWGFGSVMGLSARALQLHPSFPTYPFALSTSQITAGLVAPAAAVTLLGKSGAVSVLLVVFMAATSAASAELIAVSSIIVYDIIPYFKPMTGTQAVKTSHIAIGIWLGAWSTILQAVGIDLGWLFYVQAVFLSPAVIPIGLTVCWSRQSKIAVLGGSLFGNATGFFGWFYGCYRIAGSISIPNLAMAEVCLCGSATGLVISGLTTLILSAIFPANYDWTSTRKIRQPDSTHTTGDAPEGTKADPSDEEVKIDEKKSTDVSVVPLGSEQDVNDAELNRPAISDDAERAYLQKVFVRAAWISLSITMIITFIIPITMFAASYVMSRNFFSAWIAFSIVWALAAGGMCILLPVWESRAQIFIVARSMVRLVTGGGKDAIGEASA